ncbi:MAG TPA: hypothetical protein VE863_02395 [Pyrinomonadaceae bacterium]|jgi:hypothetical protein|nr:hypothetical protein [Pyrinomonadaceae bacterium]
MTSPQKDDLNVPAKGTLDFVSLGALVHRLDPRLVPFRKAHQCEIHVSGEEYNVAANLADCFRLKRGIATAMVKYLSGELVNTRVRAMGGSRRYDDGKARRGSRVRQRRLCPHSTLISIYARDIDCSAGEA